MIWKSRRRPLNSPADSDDRSTPPKFTLPPDNGSNCTMPLPTVVLPEPDSPTSASVRPARTDSDTPSTAFTWPTTRLRIPLRIGK